MKMSPLEKQMFMESYRNIGQGGYYPSYADCLYSSDMNYRLVRSRNRGARHWYEERSQRGKTMVKRNWMRRFPNLFTKAARKAEGLK
jgi:hypothetical protein